MGVSPDTASKLPDCPTRAGLSYGGPVGADATRTHKGSEAKRSDPPAVQHHRSNFSFAGAEYRLTTQDWLGYRLRNEDPVDAAVAGGLLRQILDSGIPAGLDDWVGPRLLDPVRRGLVVLLHIRPTGRALSPQAAEAPARTARRPVKDGWIEIEVKDDLGRHRAGDAYKLELPDGRVFTGIVNSSGIVGFHGIDPGTAKFSLTSLDRARWS